MATHRISILNQTVTPDASGNCWKEAFPISSTNDVWKLNLLRFKDISSNTGIYGAFSVPKNYVTTAKIVAVWSTSAITGDCIWTINYRAVSGNDAESLDQTGTQQTATVTDAAPTAAWRKLDASITLTSANLAVDDLVEFFFYRTGSDVLDTLAADTYLFDLLFEYSDA